MTNQIPYFTTWKICSIFFSSVVSGGQGGKRISVKIIPTKEMQKAEFSDSLRCKYVEGSVNFFSNLWIPPKKPHFILSMCNGWVKLG